MIIRNCTQYFTKSKLRQFISVLPKEYREIDVEISFYSNLTEAKEKILSTADYNAALTGEYVGAFNHYAKTINIFLFNYLKDGFITDSEEICIIFFILLHEIQHAKQYWDNPKKFERTMKKYISPVGNPNYRKQKIEIEADTFAREAIAQYGAQWAKIFPEVLQ